MDRHLKIKSDTEAARVEFISTELDLAETFCHIALSSAEPAKHERNAQYAEQAYGAAKRFLEDTHLTAREHKEIREKLAGLESLLEKLRRTV